MPPVPAPPAPPVLLPPAPPLLASRWLAPPVPDRPPLPPLTVPASAPAVSAPFEFTSVGSAQTPCVAHTWFAGQLAPVVQALRQSPSDAHTSGEGQLAQLASVPC
jgi:hypothetical protein